MRRSRLRRLARRALCALEVCGELSVALVDDAQMRALNQRYRRLDRTTDVLAFPQGAYGLVGDVVLSVETARRRAGASADRLERELARCLLHGILHLAGWDHHTAVTRRLMRRRERQIWRIAWDDGDSGEA